jgi:hypothetical protein
LCLISCSHESLEAKLSFSIINHEGVSDEGNDIEGDTFCMLNQDKPSWGLSEFIKRSDINDPSKDILKDGALCIDVTIQVRQIANKNL